jgi:sigma-E factor negative regulatory protein RseB
VETGAGTVSGSPIDILASAGQAARRQNFQGVVIYQGDRMLDSLRIVHRYKDDHESERITTLNGEARDLVREDDHIYCVLPKDRRLQIARPAFKGFLEQLTPDRLRELAAWYDFKPMGLSRVAGRTCVGAAVVARDAFRYGYELWADQETGVPLKFSLIDPDGHVLEQVMFTDVSFPATIADDSFRLPPATGESRVEQKVVPPPLPLAPLPGGEGADDSHVTFASLPPGYRVVLQREEDLPDGSGRVTHSLITDGLSTISVFSDEVRGVDHELHGLIQRGSFQAYGRLVGAMHVTIIGDAPAATMRMIGDNMQEDADALTPQAMPSAQAAAVRSADALSPMKSPPATAASASQAPAP